MTQETKKKPSIAKIGAIAGSIAAVGGVTWAVVKAILFVGIIYTKIEQTSVDTVAIKNHLIAIEESCQSSVDEAQEADRRRFRENERATTALRHALGQLQVEVRLRHNENPPSFVLGEESSMEEASAASDQAMLEAIAQE